MNLDLDLDVVGSLVDADAINAGEWLHFVSPATGAPLYADPPETPAEKRQFPCRAKVRSYRSKAFQDSNLADQAVAAGGARKVRGETQIQRNARELRQNRGRNFARLLIGWENMSTKETGKFIEPPKSELLKMADVTSFPHLQWIVEQVIKFGFDDENFGGSDDLGNDQGDQAEGLPSGDSETV